MEFVGVPSAPLRTGSSTARLAGRAASPRMTGIGRGLEGRGGRVCPGETRARCGAASEVDPTHDEETVMNGAPRMDL